MSDTPKTDDVSFYIKVDDDTYPSVWQWVVDREFAREQERTIAERERSLDYLLPSWRDATGKDLETAIVDQQRRAIAELVEKATAVLAFAQDSGHHANGVVVPRIVIGELRAALAKHGNKP